MFEAVTNLFKPKPAEFVFDVHKHTPDLWKLEQFAFQNIFVSDDLMTGKKHHSIIKDAAYSGEPIHPVCYTFDKFTFFKKDLGEHSFPVSLPWDYRPTSHLRWPVVPARVKGELYTIRPKSFIELDKLRLNGVQFHRQRVRVVLPYREVRFDKKHILPNITDDYILTTTAWMYVGAPKYWDDQIGGIFQSCQVDTNTFDQPKKWIDEFYKF